VEGRRGNAWNNPVPPWIKFLKFPGGPDRDAPLQSYRSGICSPDLKPAPSMLRPQAQVAGLRPRQAAFPLATAQQWTGCGEAKVPGDRARAPSSELKFIRPEQVKGKSRWPERHFFAGPVLYEILRAGALFEVKSQLSVASAILENDPAPISIFKPIRRRGWTTRQDVPGNAPSINCGRVLVLGERANNVDHTKATRGKRLVRHRVSNR